MPYTSHGHPYGTIGADDPPPRMVARCGGPGICNACAAERAGFKPFKVGGGDVRDGDQPLPTPNDRADVQTMVIADMEERRRVGIARYGTALQPGNGRDALRDLYEELLDAACYIRQCMAEAAMGLNHAAARADERRRLAAAILPDLAAIMDAVAADDTATRAVHDCIALVARHTSIADLTLPEPSTEPAVPVQACAADHAADHAAANGQVNGQARE